MAATFETFQYAYALSKSGGVFTLVDASPGQTGIQSVANGITLKDPDGGTLNGDTNLKVTQIDAGSMSSTGGQYKFIGSASFPKSNHPADGVINGYIVKDDNGNFYFLADSPYAGTTNGSNGQIPVSSVDDTAPVSLCFMAGTQIATPEGTVAVEDLTVGQMILTSEGKAAPVRWVGRQTVASLFAGDNLPIRIKANAIADNVPSRDLLVSPAHALLVDGVLAQAGALVNGVSVVQEQNVAPTFIYYHVELDDHSLILAENVPAETFVDNVERGVFDNWAEYQALYPEGKNVTEMEYPRAKAYRQVPKSVRERLAARGQALFGGVAANAA